MDDVICWLLKGDVSMQYLTHRDLLHSDLGTLSSLQRRIETEGFGAKLLSCRGANGHWGIWFYQPKWTCTHYTLTDLFNIGMPRGNTACREMVTRAFDECQQQSGGVNFAKSLVICDVCVNGMILAYASYFCADDPRIEKLAAFLIGAAQPDGGFAWAEQGQPSDPHSTICVLEGLSAYEKAGFTRHLPGVKAARQRALEYLFGHRLFTGEDVRYEKLAYPYRYRYDLLRFLDYCAEAGIPRNAPIESALDWLKAKQQADGKWVLELAHKGNVHFDMETVKQPSRFITLKALKILRCYDWI